MPRNEEIDLIEMIYARKAIKEINHLAQKRNEEYGDNINPFAFYRRYCRMNLCEIHKDYFKKIGNINFEKFLQIIYSDYRICVGWQYSFDELNDMFSYEKWNKIKPSIYTFILCTSNNLPNDIIRHVSSYLKIGNKNPKNKILTNENEVYDLYYSDMLLYRKEIARHERMRKHFEQRDIQRGIVRKKSIEYEIRCNKRKLLVDSIINELAKKLGKVGQ
jgi:hypothetical protein